MCLLFVSNHDYNYVGITYWYMPCLCNSFVYSTIQWVCELLWSIQPHEAADKDEHLAAMQTLKADQWPHERDSTVYFGIHISETFWNAIIKQNLLAFWPRFQEQRLGHTWTLDTWDRWGRQRRTRCNRSLRLPGNKQKRHAAATSGKGMKRNEKDLK